MTEVLFKSLPNLVELIMSNNKVENISPSIKHLYRLKVLKLNSNSIKMLPDEIGLLSNLKHLDVADN